MLEKMSVITVLYAAIFFFDMPKLKKESRRAAVIYLLFLMATLYLSANYIFELHGPDYYKVFEHIIGKPADAIVKYLNVTP